MSWRLTLQAKARLLRSEVTALYLATRDRRTPLAAKLVVLAVLAYALSPIDLIPDFIPVLGLLDDLLIVPLGIALAIRMIPREVLDEARAAAPRAAHRVKRLALWGLAIIICVWIAIAVFLFFAFRYLAD